MSSDVDDLLLRWTRADLIDEETAARIRVFEREQAGSGRLRWPVLVAVAFGALMVAAGVLLFVAAHWDTLSPQARFALVLLLVAVFHVAASAVADRFPAMSSALHAIGTVALGAGIFLAGQIFNLDEHWPGGLMLWALGAAVAALLLGDAPQLALLATLGPAWLASEWFVAAGQERSVDHDRVAVSGIFLLAISYFTCSVDDTTDHRRRVLIWLGRIWLLPAAAFLALIEAEKWRTLAAPQLTLNLALGWAVAVGLPLLVAIAFRRKAAWPNVVAAVWVLVLVALFGIDLAQYGWWAIGATALVAWGVSESRPERINMGAAIFAATVAAFYFSEVMDKLGRSASLVGLGLLFLAGGWALERVRRRLIARVRGAA